MKICRKLSILLAVCVACAAAVQGAFWKKRSDAKEAPDPEPSLAEDTGEAAAAPVQSLSQLSIVEPAPSPSPNAPPAATPASGTAFDASGRRAHFLMPDDESVDALVQLASSRAEREEELRVLARLLKEKDGELMRMNQRLEERFGISPDANYQYNNETQTLFLLKARPEAELTEDTPAEEMFEKQLHMTLRDKKMEVEFVRLVSAKKITSSELQVLRLLIKEKNLELAKVHATLQERFAVSPDKHYEYDPGSKTLYEVVKAGATP